MINRSEPINEYKFAYEKHIKNETLNSAHFFLDLSLHFAKGASFFLDLFQPLLHILQFLKNQFMLKDEKDKLTMKQINPKPNPNLCGVIGGKFFISLLFSFHVCFHLNLFIRNVCTVHFVLFLFHRYSIFFLLFLTLSLSVPNGFCRL